MFQCGGFGSEICLAPEIVWLPRVRDGGTSERSDQWLCLGERQMDVGGEGEVRENLVL